MAILLRLGSGDYLVRDHWRGYITCSLPTALIARLAQRVAGRLRERPEVGNVRSPHRKEGENLENLKITELIGRAAWREAVTYRNTWPHEYVLSRKDGQRELIELVCSRFRAGEGVAGTFFGRPNTYLFLDDYKYWLMTHWDEVDLDDGQDYVLNRARLYRDRRDFVIQSGDTGKREDYPTKPARSN